jgi:hypothetical protein
MAVSARKQLNEARSYAYGGALIQDLGYYPFGSHLFTDLTHYVRSGDFVESLIRDARDPNEYAFALGALAHYAFDNTGHPVAVNLAVPIMYPKVRAQVGPRALYVDSPSRHLMVEFAFDVLQVASGAYAAQDYRESHRVSCLQAFAGAGRAGDLRPRARGHAAECGPGDRDVSTCRQHDHPGNDGDCLAGQTRRDRGTHA